MMRFALLVSIFSRLLEALLPWRCEPTACLTMLCAEQMLGTEYVAGSLENEGPEELNVQLDRTDCIIFVETALAMARNVKENGADAKFEDLCALVRQTRYRGGRIDGYSSRIHYTTEWIRQAEAYGLVKDLSMEIGGEVRYGAVDFMSTHRQLYPKLNDEREFAAIRKAESNLNRTPQTFIPKARVKDALGSIRHGDIICFTSRAKGLDIAHVGFAYVKDGRVGLLHASSKAGKVIIDPKPLKNYLDASSFTGIKVVRIL